MALRPIQPPSSPRCRQRTEPAGLAVRRRGGTRKPAGAPPTASCKNSRRCLSAIVFFVRSPSEPDRLKTARHGVAPSQDEKSALRRKPAASPARSILGGEVVYRFLRRRETHFSPSAKRRRPRAALRLETAAARGDIAQA